MTGSWRIAPLDTDSVFHIYDKVVRENVALRRAVAALDSTPPVYPTGASIGELQEENSAMRGTLERRGIPLPIVSDGPVQPSTKASHPRRHIVPYEDDGCPSCGAERSGHTCRCGFILRGGPQPRPGFFERRRAMKNATLVPADGPPPLHRPVVRWDRSFAWIAGIVFVLLGILWILQPVLR